MNTDFGELHKRYRQAAKKTLVDVAKLLELSTSYVSDIERGHRAPYSNERIEKVAELFGAPAAPLLRAAAVSRGVFELSTNVSEPGREAGASLMRVWDQLTPQDFEELSAFVRNKGGGHQ